MAETDEVPTIQPLHRQEEPRPGRFPEKLRRLREPDRRAGLELGRREQRGGAADERRPDGDKPDGGGVRAAESGVRGRRQVPGGGEVRSGGGEPEPGPGTEEAEADVRGVEEGLRVEAEGDEGDITEAGERRGQW